MHLSERKANVKKLKCKGLIWSPSFFDEVFAIAEVELRAFRAAGTEAGFYGRHGLSRLGCDLDKIRVL